MASNEITVHAPAKLNLFFEVLARRSDGYHEIETLMCPIDLYDTICVAAEPGGQIALECRGGGGVRASWMSDVPHGPQNLVVRAILLLQQRAAVRSGARVRLVKRIPTAAGLGGGSSDAAAALWAASVAWGLGWPREALIPLAAELGSDVPFFLVGGPAVCRGRGERVEPVAGLGTMHFVVVRPPEGLSTPAVYRACRPAEQPRPLPPLLEALRCGDYRRVGRQMINRLEPAAMSLSPWIERLRNELARLDCPAYMMSGSGTSCFGLCRHACHALRVARRLRARIAGSVFAVRSCR